MDKLKSEFTNKLDLKESLSGSPGLINKYDSRPSNTILKLVSNQIKTTDD